MNRLIRSLFDLSSMAVALVFIAASSSSCDETPAAKPDANQATSAPELVEAARAAMARRDLLAARRCLETASKAATTPDQQQAVSRTQTLLDSLTEFWKAVFEEADKLQVTEEIQLGESNVVAVVQAGRELVLRMEGKNQAFTAAKLPGPIAIALVQRRARPGDPTGNLHIGSFLAIDAQGNRSEARHYWQRAGKLGESLLPELKNAPPKVTIAAPTAKRVEPPEAQEIGRLKKEIRDGMAADFTGAKDRVARVSLTKKVFETAEKTDNDPARRYALYDLARTMAVALGDPDMIGPIVEAMGYYYQVDPLSLKAESLAAAWRTRDAAAPRDTLFKAALDTFTEAVEAKQYDTAERLHTIVVAGARASKNMALLRKIEEQSKHFKRR